MSDIKIAVITGGHPFDVQPFRQLFRALPGIDAYIQHTDEFVSESEAVRDSYDAFVFYSMFKETPTDDGVPWYAGTPKTALDRLGQTKQGIVLLHHALLAYPDWTAWDEIAGIMKIFSPAWLLKHPAQVVPILGAGKLAWIRSAIQGERVQLSREQWFEIWVASTGKRLP